MRQGILLTNGLVMVDPDAVILFEVAVTFVGPAEHLPKSGRDVQLLLARWGDGELPGLSFSRVTGVELGVVETNKHTFLLGFTVLKGTGKGTGEAVANDTLRRQLGSWLKRQWEEQLPRMTRWDEVGLSVEVGEVLRLHLSSVERMVRLVKAGRELVRISGACGVELVPPNAKAGTVENMAALLDHYLDYEQSLTA